MNTAALLGAALAVCSAHLATAQTYPAKPMRLISPYPPGGGTDATARIVAQALGDQIGQQVIVDSRGGASGRIGTELAAKSPPGRLHAGARQRRAARDSARLGHEARVQRGEGFPAGQPDRDFGLHPDRASFAARALGERADRARAREAERAHLRLERQHGRAASGRRAHQPARQSEHPARAVQGQRSRGGRDPDRRIADDVRQRPFGRAAHRCGQAARARDHRPEAHDEGAAGDGRTPARLRSHAVVRHPRSGRHAERHRRRDCTRRSRRSSRTRSTRRRW